MNEIAALACAYHEQGFNVLPLDRDKRPVVEWTPWQTKRQTAEDLTALPWQRVTTAGVGAVMGAVSGDLVCIDADRAPGKHVLDGILGKLGLPRDYAWAVHTPGKGGGWHVWVRCPGLAEKGLPSGAPEADFPGADHIELRWDGGHYTVLPGSAHPEGGSYEWVNADGVLADPPAMLTPEKLLRLAKWKGTAEEGKPAPAASLPEVIHEGQGRNNALTSFAGTMRRRGASPEAILAALKVENERICRPPLPERELQTIAQSIGKKEPGAPAAGPAEGDVEPVRMRVYTPAELLEYQAEEIDWYIEGIAAPDLLTLLAGGAKSGKTTAIAGAVSAMERGVSWAGFATRSARVLYVSEQTETTFAALLRYYGIKSCLYSVFPHRFPELTWVQIVAQAEEIAQAEGCGLIVYDTVNDLAGVENENDSMEVRRALLPLRHQAARGYGVLAVAHAGKVEDPDVAAAPRGSSAWAAGPDIILHWVREKNQDVAGPRIMGSIGRLACIDRLYVLRDGIDYIASGTVREVKNRKRQDELLAYLAEEGEPRDRRQIREHFDVSSDNTVKEWIGPLLERGEVEEERGKGGKITYRIAP